MSSTIDHSLTSSRFTPEEIDRKMSEMLKREIQDYREFWRPMMQEQRRQETESDDTCESPK